ncbi:MAG: glycoside hydrolase family 5 protein, partial [Prevotella sp.]|nr:glycoside hydrolase family 5 protein [Prevotella sp.]
MKKSSVILTFLMAFLLSKAHAQGRFTTQGTQLIDATGQPFVIKGINNPHAWFGERAFQALADIAATRANTVR